MFAQYNQQYQHAGGTTVSTNGMVWNGNAWVSAGYGGHRPASNGSSTDSTGNNVQVSAALVESASNLVTKYTKYYHQWTARGQEYEQHIEELPLNSHERIEAQQQAGWSKYYADQASMAAHHYYSNPHTPAPFELPPAPPAAGQPVPEQQPQHQPVQQQQSHPTPGGQQTISLRWEPLATAIAPTATPSSPSSDGPPGGLKRYVHRCLGQCKTPEQRKTIERETERMIANALQNGTLHTTIWDATPLIPIPGAKRYDLSPSQSTRHYGRPEASQSSKKQKVTINYSYFTAFGDRTPSLPEIDQCQSAGFNGPAPTRSHNNGTHTSSPTSHHSYHRHHHHHHHHHHQQQQQQQQCKYQPGHCGLDPMVGEGSISVPQFGKKSKKSNKYVNPNTTKPIKSTIDDGFLRSSSALSKRANRFSGPGGNDDVRQATAKGVDDRYMGKGVIGGLIKKLDETDYEHMTVKGTCMKSEKQYLRLTAPPKPELVRPLGILQQHLKNLREEFYLSPTKRDYLWFCSEMKSMRQDLTVQHISNAFTVEAYEFHARIALQEGDVNEFNQAQTQLRILYGKLDDPRALKYQNEFVAYLVIYFVMLLLNKKYTGGSSDLLNLMLSLTPSQREDPAIRHALQVRAAVAEVDYHKFFRLYSSCPNLGGKLMDLMVPSLRHWALQRICKGYRPIAGVTNVLKAIGFDEDKPEEIDDGKKFLVSCGCVLNSDGTEIRTKDSVVRESDLQAKKSLI